MSNKPYMQWYPSDYLADTQHLTTEEHGAYCLLLMNHWQKRKPLDNTNKRLANVCKLSIERWEQVEIVLAEFFIIDENTWSHSRIMSDLARVDEVIESRSKAGIRSGEARRNKKETSVQQELNIMGTKGELLDKNILDKNILNKRRDISPSAFDDWWVIYPRRDGSKKKAREAFDKALLKTTLETLTSTAISYAKDPNRDDAYTKMATTWLNQECWESEPLPKPNRKPRNVDKAEQAFALAQTLREEGR